MRLFTRRNTLRGKLLLFYRRMRHNKGYGVHSPFVYHLITKVIKERAAYYCFREIEDLRKELLQRTDVAKVVRRYAIRPKHGALLFRLANHFQSKNILQVGSSLGFSALYLTAYAKDARCVLLESVPEFAAIVRQVHEKKAPTNIDLFTGDYRTLLPDALRAMGKVDFLCLRQMRREEDMRWVYATCLPYLTTEAVLVCEGIRQRKEMRCLWKEICHQPEATVTLDLFNVGVVLFTKKSHKRNYTVYY